MRRLTGNIVKRDDKEELIECGKELKAIEIAKQLLLRREPVYKISEITGLTRNEVQNL